MNHQHWSQIYENIAKYLREWAENEIRKRVLNFSDFIHFDIEEITDDIWDSLAFSLYQKCNNSVRFHPSNEWLVKFDKISQKIDPLHVFASFNAANISKELRYERMGTMCYLLGEDVGFDKVDIDFYGCPTPVVINSLAVRNDKEVQSIWKCFFAAFYYRRNNLLRMEPFFNNALDISGVGMASLTIFLFWINPQWFMPLDKNTIHLLKNIKIMKQEPLDFVEYMNILNINSATMAYIDIARLAYHKKKQSITATDYFNEELDNYLRSKLSEPEIAHIYNGTEVEVDNSAGFQIIALKILPECNTSYSKSLRKDKLFIFNNCFTFNDDNTCISYEQNMISNKFYTGEDNYLNIMVNAIVGKNGAGKSTIVEIILTMLNNVNIFNQNSDNQIVDGIHVELFIHANLKIYKFVLKGNNFSAIDYNISDNNNSEDNKFTCDDINKEYQLTYEHKEVIASTYFLCLNYSQFGFNSSQLGMEWVGNLFHRNDTYQFPILFEPKRDKGNIDINLQTRLAKNRLLTNLFNYNYTLDATAARENFKISEFSYVEKLVFTIDNEKLKKHNILDESHNSAAIQFSNELINNLFPDFIINNEQDLTENELLILNYTKQYLYYKLKGSSIANGANSHYDFKEICKELTNDLSFRTRKMWNAINFIRLFNEYKKLIINGKEVDVFDISKLMYDLKSKYDASDFIYKDNVTVEHFMPPSFFLINIILSNNVAFDSLSSGEKQLIFSVNTVLYHLRNLDSLSRTNSRKLRRYNYVNVFLDEIELYFHPELQRKYINSLINDCKNKLYSNLLWGVNFIFVTHSPFILSDIQTSQILFLDRVENNSIPKNVKTKTLGANIHDLLINGMFLDNLTGEFVYNKIQDFLKFFNKVS